MLSGIAPGRLIFFTYGIDAELFVGTNGDDAVAMAFASKKTLYPFSIKNRKLTDADVRELIRPELYEDFKKKYKLADKFTYILRNYNVQS